MSPGMPKWNSAKLRSKARYALPPIDDVVVIVAGCNRAARRHQEQHLAQRIHDLPGLPRVRDLRDRAVRAGVARRGLDRSINRFIMKKAYQNRDDVLAIRAIYVGGDTQCVLGFSDFGCLDR